MFRNVIWLADTNYRIDLDNATVRSLAEHDDFDPLLAADQVGSLPSKMIKTESCSLANKKHSCGR